MWGSILWPTQPPLLSGRPAPCQMKSSLHACVGATVCVSDTRQLEGSSVHLLLLLKKLHELVKSVSNLRKEKQFTVIVCSFITTCKVISRGRDEPTCSDGLLSFSAKAEKVSREAPFVFRSIRIARSSSLEKQNTGDEQEWRYVLNKLWHFWKKHLIWKCHFGIN